MEQHSLVYTSREEYSSNLLYRSALVVCDLWKAGKARFYETGRELVLSTATADDMVQGFRRAWPHLQGKITVVAVCHNILENGESLSQVLALRSVLAAHNILLTTPWQYLVMLREATEVVGGGMVTSHPEECVPAQATQLESIDVNKFVVSDAFEDSGL